MRWHLHCGLASARDLLPDGPYPAIMSAHLRFWAQVIRIFGFSTAGAGEVTCCAGRVPIIQAPGVYNEVALKHFDYFMDACAKVRGRRQRRRRRDTGSGPPCTCTTSAHTLAMPPTRVPV